MKIEDTIHFQNYEDLESTIELLLDLGFEITGEVRTIQQDDIDYYSQIIIYDPEIYDVGISDTRMLTHIEPLSDNGKRVTWYTNGKRKDLVTLKEGKLDGDWFSWYEDGNLLAVRNYTENYYDLEWIEYFPSGQIKLKHEYSIGSPSGVWEKYFEDGTIMWRGRVDGSNQDGDHNQVGEWKSWYKSGQLMTKGSYNEAGERVGEWFRWRKNGDIFFENKFGDVAESRCVTYYSRSGKKIESFDPYPDLEIDRIFSFYPESDFFDIYPNNERY